MMVLGAFNEFEILCLGLLEPAAGREGIGEVDADRRHVRRHSDGLLELLDRLVQPALCRQGGAEVVVRLAQVGPQRGRPGEVMEGPLHLDRGGRVEPTGRGDVIDMAAGKLLGPQPVVGLPGVLVVLQRVRPEFVLVDPGRRQAERDPGQ